MRRRSEKYVIKGSKYAHWIGLYLSFHLNWVFSPQPNEVTFAHVITPLTDIETKLICCMWHGKSPDECSLALQLWIRTRVYGSVYLVHMWTGAVNGNEPWKFFLLEV